MTMKSTQITVAREKQLAPLHDNSGSDTPKTAAGGRQMVDSERALDKPSEDQLASRTA